MLIKHQGLNVSGSSMPLNRASRREFIALMAIVPAGWPQLARAQQPAPLRRIGTLTALSEGDLEGNARDAALREGLKALGWVEGRNIHIETRRTGGSGDRLTAAAMELARLQPEVIVAYATTALAAIQRATGTIPIVFAQVTDPVGAGFVASLARPGGNITGFTQHEFSISLKWLQLLKEIAPHVGRVAVFYDPENPATAGYLTELEGGAPTFNVQISRLVVRSASEVEQAFGMLAGGSNGGVIVLPGAGTSVLRESIIALAERHRLPAVYPFRYWVKQGGLAFYGVDNIDLYRRAASYVDRILKGDKPAELPVQHATTFQLVINLKAAKALGLQIPPKLHFTADEVIE
jgi:putative ABC transport system substrate-binding protein